MTQMDCKLKKEDGSVCGVRIDYNPDTKKAFNLDNSPHLHAKKKFFTSKKAVPIETELELLGRITTIEEQVAKLDTAVQAIVAQLKLGEEV
jgi:hypothetical protein